MSATKASTRKLYPDENVALPNDGYDQTADYQDADDVDLIDLKPRVVGGKP